MPGKRVSMRKTREGLRLYFDLKLEQRQIARSANVSQSTVHNYLSRLTAAGLVWSLPEQMLEAELEAALFGPPHRARQPLRGPQSFSAISISLTGEIFQPGEAAGTGSAGPADVFPVSPPPLEKAADDQCHRNMFTRGPEENSTHCRIYERRKRGSDHL